MKIGSLVKYVGSAAMYRDRVGVLTQTYGAIDDRIDSALVHFTGLEGKGRDAPSGGTRAGGQIFDGLHPMALIELEVVSEGR